MVLLCRNGEMYPIERQTVLSQEDHSWMLQFLLKLRFLFCVIVPALACSPFLLIRDVIFSKHLKYKSKTSNGIPVVETSSSAPTSFLGVESSDSMTSPFIPHRPKNLAIVTFGGGEKRKECKLVTAAASPCFFGGIPRRIVLSLVGCFGLIVNNYNKVKTYNLDTLAELIYNRPDGTPLITVSNHTSALDDPFMWCLFGIASSNPKFVRWTLAARNNCFSNFPTAFFFRLGKCIPLGRGDGIHQDGMMEALSLLDRGEWLHIFPEGRLFQDCQPVGRLKWGVSSLISRCEKTPVILCIGISGYQNVMPGKSFSVPLWGKAVSIVVGEPFQFDMTKLRNEAVEAIENGNIDFGADCFKKLELSADSDSLSMEEKGVLLKAKLDKIEEVGDCFTRRLYSEMARTIQGKLNLLVLEAHKCVGGRERRLP